MPKQVAKNVEDILVGDTIPYKGKVVTITSNEDCYTFTTDLGKVQYYPPGAYVTLWIED